MTTIYNFSANDLAGRRIYFSDFVDKALLIVNTASKCGFAPQFASLQMLHERYCDRGLIVIGFPCNQFGAQEPYDSAITKTFCQLNYGVDFLMMEKIKVNGRHAHPLYVWLKSECGGLFTDEIKWNFTKFLVNRDGKVISRYAPITKPEAIMDDIENIL